jgi:hypothetical protein
VSGAGGTISVQFVFGVAAGVGAALAVRMIWPPAVVDARAAAASRMPAHGDRASIVASTA